MSIIVKQIKTLVHSAICALHFSALHLSSLHWIDTYTMVYRYTGSSLMSVVWVMWIPWVLLSCPELHQSWFGEPVQCSCQNIKEESTLWHKELLASRANKKHVQAIRQLNWYRLEVDSLPMQSSCLCCTILTLSIAAQNRMHNVRIFAKTVFASGLRRNFPNIEEEFS